MLLFYCSYPFFNVVEFQKSQEQQRSHVIINVVDTPDIVPIEDLIASNGTVIGDISWMLDFAIIGFPKSGTTFMKGYLNQTDKMYLYEREMCIKHWSDLPGFVKKYHEAHEKLKQSKQQKRVKFGLKCPGVLYRKSDLAIYQRYFPKTKFIIGLRQLSILSKCEFTTNVSVDREVCQT